jgi:hypothetical protein
MLGHMIATSEAPAPGWAAPIRRLHAPAPPPGAINLNVDGRRLIGTQQGFGQLWQRTYRVPLAGSPLTPEQVVSAWKEHFGEFWPSGNRFFGSREHMAPGEVALINLAPMPGPVKLTTGVMVIYADDVSFTFMAPEGHMYAGWNTFSAYVEDGVTWAQVQVLVRTSDPAWEIVMRLFAFKAEDAFWCRTLRNLAEYFGVCDPQVEQKLVLVDPRVQWSRALNTWRNAAMWSGLYIAAAPLRWAAGRIRHQRPAATY